MRGDLAYFGSHTTFREGKTPKISFVGLSLLSNPTETLATRAITSLKIAIDEEN